MGSVLRRVALSKVLQQDGKRPTDLFSSHMWIWSEAVANTGSER